MHFELSSWGLLYICLQYNMRINNNDNNKNGSYFLFPAAHIIDATAHLRSEIFDLAAVFWLMRAAGDNQIGCMVLISDGSSCQLAPE